MSKRNTKRTGRVSARCRSAALVIDHQDDAGIAQFFSSHGMALMPLAQLLSECKVKLSDLLADAGRGLIECLLMLSAQSVAGAKSQGREVEREVVWHGQQTGRVELLERQLQVQRP